MKIKEGYLLRQVASNYVVVAVGSAVMDFNGMITLNDTGALLWNTLEQGSDRDGLIQALLAEYDVERSVAEADIDAFIKKLQGADLIEE